MRLNRREPASVPFLVPEQQFLPKGKLVVARMAASYKPQCRSGPCPRPDSRPHGGLLQVYGFETGQELVVCVDLQELTADGEAGGLA